MFSPLVCCRETDFSENQTGQMFLEDIYAVEAAAVIKLVAALAQLMRR